MGDTRRQETGWRRARAHFLRGDVERALASYDDALARTSDDTPTWRARLLRKRATTLRFAGRDPDAEADLDRALALAPGDSEQRSTLLLRVEILRELGRLDDALAVCDLFAERWPDRGDLHANRARVRFERGELEAALADVDRSLQLDVPHAWIRALRVEILHALGRLDDTRASLDALLADVPGSKEALLSASGMDLSERPDEALALAERALAVDPLHGPAFAARGRAQLALGQREAGLADLQRATRLLAPRSREGTRARGDLAQARAGSSE
jgi:tetratricopeptide (TPR) repeat protein